MVLVWTLPELHARASAITFGKRGSDRDVLDEVNAFCDALLGAADTFGTNSGRVLGVAAPVSAAWVCSRYAARTLGLKALLRPG